MIKAVIDIGSNSIRLLVDNDKNKLINTTQLAEGLSISGILNNNAMERTAIAINEFYQLAIERGADKVYAFATEAVRSARNGGDFIKMMKDRYAIDIDLLSPEEEARAGFTGAYNGGNACVIDIGGASTEIVTGNEKGINYARSIPIGIVRLKDICGTDRDKLNDYIPKKLAEFGDVGHFDYGIAIGGTASAVVAMIFEGFNREIVHHYHLTRIELNMVLHVLDTVPDINAIKGLPVKRAEVIIGGILLLDHIMDMLGLDEVLVSENDNIEGYLKLRCP